MNNFMKKGATIWFLLVSLFAIVFSFLLYGPPQNALAAQYEDDFEKK